MEEGSGYLSKSDLSINNQSQQSFQCSHCVVILKSKHFLLEHLSKVHGLMFESSKRGTELTTPSTATSSNIATTLYDESLRDIFACRHCLFKSSNRNVLFKHEKVHHRVPHKVIAFQPHKRYSKSKLITVKHCVTESKTPATSKKMEKMDSVKETSVPQSKQEGIDNLNYSTLKSTSKNRTLPILSKNRKTYVRSSGDITNFLVASSESTKNSYQLKKKSPKMSGLIHSDNYAKITATTLNDIQVSIKKRCSIRNPMETCTDTPSLGIDMCDTSIKGTFSNQTTKRTHYDDTPISPAKKKYKTDTHEESSDSISTAINTKLSVSSTFTLDVKGDEARADDSGTERKKDSLKKLNFCKHCDYSNSSVRSVSTHYQSAHPYVRYNFKYIQDPDDMGATWRCLECPVEFPTVEELMKHYRDHHPDAPDVFTQRSHNLVFKCFACPFTTSSKDLKAHYKEKHPTYKGDNSLLYCSYTAREPLEGSPSETYEPISRSPKTTELCPTKKASTPKKEITTPPFKQRPVSKANEGAYNCKHCLFSNNSVVAVLVHYQKSHPEAGVTLAKIKQSSIATSSLEVKGKSKVYPQNNVSQTSTILHEVDSCNTFIKSDIQLEDIDDLFFCQFCNYSFPNVRGVLNHQRSQHRSIKRSAESINVYTAKIRSKGKKNTIPNIYKQNNLSQMQEEPDTPFLCQLCDYSNSTIKGVLVHQKTSHSENKTNVEEVLKYTLDTLGTNEITSTSGTLDSKLDLYKPVDALFFCQQCNFGHPTMQGVLSHQKKKHNGLISSREVIFRYTAGIRGQTKRSKPLAVGSSYSTGLPFPLLQDDAEGMLFCQLCNYSFNKVKVVLQHQRKKHPELQATAGQIFKYSSMVYEQTGQSQIIGIDLSDSSLCRLDKQDGESHNPGCKTKPCQNQSSTVQSFLNHQRLKRAGIKVTAEQAVNHTTTEQEQSEEKQTKQSNNSVAPSNSKTVQARSLKCRKCIYTCQNFYLLKRHMRSNHQMILTMTDILRWAFQDGAVGPGFHCEWCVFSHSEATGLHKHCKKQHSDRGVSLAHIESRLHVSSKVLGLRKKKPQLKSNFFQSNTVPKLVEGTNTSRMEQQKENDAMLYSCRACSFKCTSVEGIKSHYHAVHPLSVKEDDLVLGVIYSKQQSASFEGKEQLDNVGHQSEALSAHKTIKPTKFYTCPFCSSPFNKWHGLKTHCGKKHPEFKKDLEDFKPEIENESSQVGGTNVYKCERCTYVNTHQHGVLTHCQMKHPSFKARGEKLRMDVVYFPNIDECARRKSRKDIIGGHKCRICPVTHASLKKLQSHYEKDHNQTAPNMLRKTVTRSDVIKKQLFSKYRSTQGSLYQSTLFTNKRSDVVKDLSIRNGPVKCFKCPNLFFNSTPLLSKHYSHCHSREFKRDFTIISSNVKKSSISFKCNHCKVKIQGCQKLYFHLDHHVDVFGRQGKDVKMRKSILSGKQLETKHVIVNRQDELPEFQTIQKLAQWNVKKTETSPQSSPSMITRMGKPDKKSRRAKDCTCHLCGRTFMSVTGLRVHERSHAAMAAVKRLDTLFTSSKHITDKYISHRPGTIKPFLCGLCAYRTNLIGFLRSHLIKKHSAECPDIDIDISSINKEKERALGSSEEASNQADLQRGNLRAKSVLTEKPVYLEPPDVQRQLNHYRQVAQTNNAASGAPQVTRTHEDGLLYCEFCNFSTGHLSSIRRHYLHRHNGRKLLRCKDCSFFTGLRNTLNMHIEAGHSSCPSEPTHQKDLRCPFCLYQTKNKNNMIDHIVLHREERVIPIEVRRPKLSHYLQGILFRCHKCTFTSASEENLCKHMQKHDDIKPYKCRLCYFDCTQLSDLEAHLCYKHQVTRNHELVGQINLEQLETRPNKLNGERIETGVMEQGMVEENMETNIQLGSQSHMKEKNNENIAEQHNEKTVGSQDTVDNGAKQEEEENNANLDDEENIEEDHKLNQKWDENAQVGNPVDHVEHKINKSNTFEGLFKKLDILGNSIHQGIGIEKNCKKNNMQESHTDNIQQSDKVHQNRGVNIVAHNIAKQENIEQNHSVRLKQEREKDSSIVHCDEASATEQIRSHQIPGNNKVVENVDHPFTVEKNRVEQMPSVHQMLQEHLHMNCVQGRETTQEVTTCLTEETQVREVTDDKGSLDFLTDENHIKHKDKGQEKKVESHKNRFELSVTDCDLDQMHTQGTNEKSDQCEEMSLLQNQKEGTNNGGRKRQKTTKDSASHECNHERLECKMDATNSSRPNDAFTATTGIVYVPLTSNGKLFACKLCGRNLINSAELERHFMRHGM